MNPKLMLGAAIAALCCLSYANAGQMFILDDEDFEGQVRVRRSAEPQQGIQRSDNLQRRDLPFSPPVALDKSDGYAPAPTYGKSHGYKKGRVGPVYTFVKTDPYANFKWGVRHVVGKQYAGR